VAHTFIAAARAPFEGTAIFNLAGRAAHMREIVSAIEEAAPAMRGRITFEDKPLPFPEEIDGASLAAALGSIPRTPLAEGVRQTIHHFRQLTADGRLARTAMLD
jgi:nucleoside-diphosphate-sugar epimerase